MDNNDELNLYIPKEKCPMKYLLKYSGKKCNL